MRRLIAILLLGAALAGCAEPVGGAVDECGPDWEPIVLDAPARPTELAQTVPVECYVVVAEQRLEIGFFMPPGPDCYALELVEVIEDDEAISLEVRVGRETRPLGACPPEPMPWGATVELNGPAEGRRVLDATRAPD